MAKYPALTTCTPAELRRLLQRYDPVTHRKAMQVLKIPVEATDRMLRECCRAGYLNYDPDHPEPTWTRTHIGQSLVVNPAIKRIPREKAQALLRTVLRRADEINADHGLHFVKEICLFGSFALLESEDVGDVDLEVKLERRDPAELEATGALDRAIAALPDPGYTFERYFPDDARAFDRDAKAVRRALAKGSRSIVITDDEIARLRASYRVAYRRDTTGTVIAEPSWAPDALIGPDDLRHVGHGKPAAKRTDDPGLGWPLPDHGANMPARTLGRAGEIALPESFKPGEHVRHTLGGLEDRRLDVLLCRPMEDGPCPLTVEDILALSMPAEATQPDSWVAGIRQAAAGLEGLPGQVACFLRFESHGQDWGEAAVTLLTEEGEAYRVVWLDAGAEAPSGRIAMTDGLHSLATLRAAWGFLPALRRAASWIQGIDELALRLSLTWDPACAVFLADRDPVFPPDALAPLRTALAGAVTFAPDPDPEAWGETREIEAERGYGRLRLKVPDGAAIQGKPRASARAAVHAFADCIESVLGEETTVVVRFRGHRFRSGRG